VQGITKCEPQLGRVFMSSRGYPYARAFKTGICIINSLFPTAQKTYHVCIRKSSRLVIFREIFGVLIGKLYGSQTHILWGKMHNFLNIKAGGTRCNHYALTY
jgi:hypothetical protein